MSLAARTAVVGALAALLALPTLAGAQVSFCDGNGGAARLSSLPWRLGTDNYLTLTGTPNMDFQILMSGSLAVQAVPPWGWQCLNPADPAYVIIVMGVMPASGSFTYAAFVPDEPIWDGMVVFVRGAVLDPVGPGGLGVAELVRADFEHQNSITNVGTMASPRIFATANTLPYGEVLIADGGVGTWLNPLPTAATEFYFPTARQFAAGPSLISARAHHVAVSLNDGRVLFAGGVVDGAGSVTNSCEIFDPQTALFAAAAPMNAHRAGAVATKLLDGRVLVAGGTTSWSGTFNLATSPLLTNVLSSGEVYDPIANTWTPAANAMSSPRLCAAATLMNDGRALVCSGISGATGTASSPALLTTSCSYFEPATLAFVDAPPVPSARAGAKAAVVAGNYVLFAGGAETGGVGGLSAQSTTTFIFDPCPGSWLPGTPLPTPVVHHALTTLDEGSALITGGTTSFFTAGLFIPSTGAAVRHFGLYSLPAASLGTPRYGHATARLNDGTVLQAGGINQITAFSNAWIYTPPIY